MKAFKFFNKDLTCTKGQGIYQFEIGKWHEEKEANCVKNGFHCCEYIADCLNYYSLRDSRVFEVIADGDIDEDGTDTKISCTRIKLVRELDVLDVAYEIASYILDHPDRSYTRSGEVSIGIDAVKGNLIAIAIGFQPRALIEGVGVIVLLQKDKDGEIINAKCRVAKPNTWYILDERGELSEEKEN